MAKQAPLSLLLPEACKDRRAYFAAANSAQGFYSLYDRNFRTRDSVYIIKGGPGTGKSRLMWDMVAAGEAGGFGAELYFCSSDPLSLDAVVLTHASGREMVFLDATAPHIMEATLPGLRDHLIDLGAFWSKDALGAQSDRITELMQKKSRAFSVAERYLAAAGLCERSAGEMLASCLDRPALLRLCRRLFASVTDDRSTPPATPKKVFTTCMGMRGRGHLPTLERAAKRICRFSSHYGAEYALLSELMRQGEASGKQMVISCDPLLPERPDALFFEQEKVLFTVYPSWEDAGCQDCYTRTISPQRVINAEALRAIRPALREAVRSRDALLLSAEQTLRAAATSHFALESIYGEAMDFTAKEAYSQALARSIFGVSLPSQPGI